MDQIPTEVIRFALVPFCDLPSVLNLSLVQRRFQYIDKDLRSKGHWIKIIRKRLEQDGVDCNTFFPALQASHAFISGSYLLQCLLGKLWIPSDIDVFCPESEYDPTLAKFLVEFAVCASKECGAGGHNMDRSGGILMSLPPNKLRLHITNYHSHPGDCDPHNTIYQWGTDLQLIKVDSPDTIMSCNLQFRSLIMEHFDFDFCKITFDGKTLRTHHISAIRTQRTPLPTEKDRVISRKRVIKYADRGFRFSQPLGPVTRNLLRKRRQQWPQLKEVFIETETKRRRVAKLPFSPEGVRQVALHFYKQEQGKYIDGWSIDDLFKLVDKKCENASLSILRDYMEELVDAGWFYSTIDEQHFRTMCPFRIQSNSTLRTNDCG